ncbi:hypothetical protein Trydic_g21814 [Trypoxylus dichotomus]
MAVENILGMVAKNNSKARKPPKRSEYPSKPHQLCVCESLWPALLICRWLGMFPVTTWHDQYGRCVFARNNKWYAYSVTMTLLSLVRAVVATDFFNIFEISRRRSLHPIIASLNDIIYSLYVTALTAINIYRCPMFVETLNRSAIMIRERLYCQSSRRSVAAVQYGVVFVFFVIVLTKFGAIFYVHISESYETGNFDYKVYSNAIVQSEIFTVYVAFIAISSMLMGMYGCYERLAMRCLNFAPIHPLPEDVDETNNVAEFMGVIDYKLCAEPHPMPERIRKLPAPETIEYLRCLHEEICVTMYRMNECLNPQFLIHVTVELTVLILNWYAVIMYMAYAFLNPVARTLHFLNICFVVVHTLGLLVFLKQAQQLQTTAGSLTNLLLEYSTRISDADEHQQIRIFVEKMKGQRPLTASGVFDIDLGIAGPVCANIVTYVLVALQFDIPKT